MKTNIIQIAIAGLFAVAIVNTPVRSRAADSTTNAPEQSAPAAAPKKHSSAPFHGKLAAVDTNAMTLTVGKRTFDITSETKITKDGKPATLADGVVGENVSGSYKKSEGDKLTARSVNFGAKLKKEKEVTN
jgi:hypothetical protein